MSNISIERKGHRQEGKVEEEFTKMEENAQIDANLLEMKEKPQKKGFKVPGWLLTAAVSLLMSVLSVFLYDRFFTQRIVALDIKGFIGEQRDLYLSGKISDEQFRANIDRLEARVKSIPRNQVVIMGDAVIKNAEVIKP